MMIPRLGPGLAASLAWHVALALLLVAARASSGTHGDRRVTRTAPATLSFVWLASPDDGGSQGGGGDDTPGQARAVRRVGPDPVTVPIAAAPAVPASSNHADTPPDGLRVPAVAMASSNVTLPGTIQPVPGVPAVSLGPGEAGGAGTGMRGGDGSGDGDGLDGHGSHGAGGEVFGLGAGVDPPVPIYRARPRYTADAVRARAQGSVLVECVVRPSGICTDARVVRALQPPFGLDREAIAAAGGWRFRPGRRAGAPVAVRITIEVAFALR